MVAVIGAAMPWAEQAVAQPAPALSNTEIAKEAVNPVTLNVTVPLRYEADFNDGPYQATKSTFAIDQAVLAFVLNDDWALITRTLRR
jgi:hypothetical protein